MAYEEKKLGVDHVAPVGGFVIVRLSTSPTGRIAGAACKVDGVVVASGSAADNSLAGVMSSPTQTFTVPVHANSTYRVDQTSGSNGKIEVRWAVV